MLLAGLCFAALGACVKVAGAWLGSHLVMRHGTVIVRPLLVIVSVAISLKLLLVG